MGLSGYAVDDGQFGVRMMDTGLPTAPLAGTKSIAENAQVLAEYVEAVRRNTGRRNAWIWWRIASAG